MIHRDLKPEKFLFLGVLLNGCFAVATAVCKLFVVVEWGL